MLKSLSKLEAALSEMLYKVLFLHEAGIVNSIFPAEQEATLHQGQTTPGQQQQKAGKKQRITEVEVTKYSVVTWLNLQLLNSTMVTKHLTAFAVIFW